MAKAYWIAQVTVTDPERYALYARRAGEAFSSYGAKIIVRGGLVTPLEGAPAPRNVVIEFDSLAAALSCYRSDEYQAAKRLRHGAGDALIYLVEGVGE